MIISTLQVVHFHGWSLISVSDNPNIFRIYSAYTTKPSESKQISKNIISRMKKQNINATVDDLNRIVIDEESLFYLKLKI